MPRGLIKIRDRYFEWSTIVDAPVTYALTKQELEEYIKERYGTEGLSELPERLKRVEQYGHSFWYTPCPYLEEFLRGNRAGEKEKALTADEIYEKFTYRETK